MANKPYVGDVGTVITLDTTEDISAATVHKMLVLKPDGTQTEWATTIVDNTKLRYTTDENSFSTSGEFRIQNYVELPSGKWKGETYTFEVYADFE